MGGGAQWGSKEGELPGWMRWESTCQARAGYMPSSSAENGCLSCPFWHWREPKTAVFFCSPFIRTHALALAVPG